MTQTTVVSLGGWCRPAWHIRRATPQTRGYPFDWHITSYRALIAVLDPSFDPMAALKPEDCFINQFGSITDGASGWIDQHNLSADKFDRDGDGIAWTDRTAAALDHARERSAFLIERFRSDCQTMPMTFVRWIRHGLVDGEWNEAFEGEDAWAVKAALERLCAHPPRLLYVMSEHLDGPDVREYIKVTQAPWGDALTIGEPTRRFFPEDLWTGDNEAWDQVFEHIAGHPEVGSNPAEKLDVAPERELVAVV